MTTEPDTAEARMSHLNILAATQRQSLMQGIAHARARLQPASLAQSASKLTLNKMLDTANSVKSYIRLRPIQALGIAAALGAVLTRGPLIRMTARGFRSVRQHFMASKQEWRSPENHEDKDG